MQYVEPLVGHMRHTHAVAPCVPAGQASAHVESREYINFGGANVSTLARLYPGRKFLLDASTHHYASGLGFLVNQYASMGIQFDEIYAWEQHPYNHSEYWKSVPAHVVPRLHLYNAPVDATPGSKMNPLTLMRNVYQPGDFVAFKLDIDADAIETSLVDQIEADTTLTSMIAEMFFEKHYHAKEMEPNFGAPDTKYPTALRQLARLRRQGLHIHYWP